MKTLFVREGGYSLPELLGVISIILGLAALVILSTGLTRCALLESAINREVALTNGAYQNYIAAGGPTRSTKADILACLHATYNGVGPFLIESRGHDLLGSNIIWDETTKNFKRDPLWTCASGSGSPPSGTPTPYAGPTATPTATPAIALTISAPATVEIWTYATAHVTITSPTGVAISGAHLEVAMPAGISNVIPTTPEEDMAAFIASEGTFEEAALGYGYADVAAMLADNGYATEQEMATDWYGGVWTESFTWGGDIPASGTSADFQIYVWDAALIDTTATLTANANASPLSATKSTSINIVGPGALTGFQITNTFVPASIPFGGTSNLVTTISSLSGAMNGSLSVTIPFLTVTSMDSNADYSTAGEIHWTGNTAAITITTGVSSAGWGDYGSTATIGSDSGSHSVYAQLHVDSPGSPPDITSVFVTNGQIEFTSGDYIPLDFTATGAPFTQSSWRWGWNQYFIFGTDVGNAVYAPETDFDWNFVFWVQVGNAVGITSSNSFGGVIHPGDTGATSGGAWSGGYNNSGDQLLSIRVYPAPVISSTLDFDGSRVWSQADHSYQTIQWYLGMQGDTSNPIGTGVPSPAGNSYWLPLTEPPNNPLGGASSTVGSVTIGSQTFYSGNTIPIWGRASNNMGRYVDSTTVMCTVPYYFYPWMYEEGVLKPEFATYYDPNVGHFSSGLVGWRYVPNN